MCPGSILSGGPRGVRYETEEGNAHHLDCYLVGNVLVHLSLKPPCTHVFCFRGNHHTIHMVVSSPHQQAAVSGGLLLTQPERPFCFGRMQPGTQAAARAQMQTSASLFSPTTGRSSQIRARSVLTLTLLGTRSSLRACLEANRLP